jgi:hypothetical protein
MWLEHLVELNRRTEPLPPLPEKQGAFVRGFSFDNDIRPHHHMAKYRPFGLPNFMTSVTGQVVVLLMYTLLCLRSWTGSPMAEGMPYVKWIAYAFIVLFPFLLLFGFMRGSNMRKRRWEFWEWPDFASFAMEEANAYPWGILNYSSLLLFLVAMIGWILR